MNLDLLRTFFAVVELGSLNKAAERLRVSQSTLTRQMHALENDIGGRVLERTSKGVALTATGHVLFEGMRPVLTQFDTVLGETRRAARGQSARVRIGYIMSAADYLRPGLAALRRAHPEVKVKLVDLSPGEQIAALRRGELDLALLGDAGNLINQEFFVRRVARIPVVVALPEEHPLAAQPALRIADLRKEQFIGAAERDMPGHNAWVRQLCRRAGFRPRLLADSESLADGLATVVNDGAVALLPEYTNKTRVPGVTFRALRDESARWDLLVAWQRGKTPEVVRVILDALVPAKT